MSHIVDIAGTLVDLDEISTSEPTLWFEGYDYQKVEKEREVRHLFRKPTIEKYTETVGVNKGYSPALNVVLKTGKGLTLRCDQDTLKYHLKKVGLLW